MYSKAYKIPFLIDKVSFRFLSFFVGGTLNQRQMRLWHLAGRDQEVAPTEESVAFFQPIYQIMSYHYLEMVLLGTAIAQTE